MKIATSTKLMTGEVLASMGPSLCFVCKTDAELVCPGWVYEPDNSWREYLDGRLGKDCWGEYPVNWGEGTKFIEIGVCEEHTDHLVLLGLV